MSGNVPALTERNPVRIMQAIRDLFSGRSNAVGQFTLTASTTTTTVTAPNASVASRIVFSPRTSNAAGALASTYVSAKAQGSFTVTHANNSQTDRTFDYHALG
jgi:hypothetical protein